MGNLQNIYGLHAHITWGGGLINRRVFQHGTSGYSILDTPFHCKHVAITLRFVESLKMDLLD